MISDKNLLKFVYLKSSKVSSFSKIEDYPKQIKEAFDNYKNDDYYMKICNEKLTTGN